MAGSIYHVFTNPQADGATTDIVRPGDWNSVHQYTLQDAVSLAGNTSGVLANISSGTLILAGGNNITLSQNGNSVTVSAFNQTAQASVFSGGISGGNTSGDTGAVTARLVLAGGNNVTLSGSTNGGSITVTVSAFNQTAPVVSNAIQVVGSATGSGTNTSRFAADDHVHAGIFSAGVSTGGNTSGDTAVRPGRIVFAGGNNVTLSMATAANSLMTVTISAQSIPPIATDANAVASANSTGTVTRFAPEDHRHAGIFSAGVSNIGNTSGDTGVIAGRIVLAGGNNVTLSVGTAAGALQTVTISAFNQTAPVVSNAIQAVGSATGSGTNTSRFAADDHVHLGVFSVGVSTGGNTSGDTAVRPGRWVLAGGNNVTLSVATGANSLQTITISAAAQTAESQTFGASNLGNTLGTSGVASGAQVRAIVVGGNNVTISQSVNGASVTQSIAAGGTHSFWRVGPPLGNASPQYGQSSMVILPAQGVNEIISASRANFFLTITHSSSADTRTLRNTFAFSVGVYTRSVSTLNLASSGSVNYSWTISSNESTAVLSGARLVSAPIDLNMTPGDYWFALLSTTNSALQAGGGGSVAASNIGGQIGHTNLAFGGILGQAINASNQYQPGQGIYATATDALPSSLAFSDIVGNLAAGQRVPCMIIGNFTA